MSDMQWTSEFPTKPGYYWIRNYAWKYDPEYICTQPDVAQVRGEYQGGGVYGDEMRFYFAGNKMEFNHEHLASAEWQGPLEPEEEPIFHKVTPD